MSWSFENSDLVPHSDARAAVVVPIIAHRGEGPARSPAAKLDEAKGLALAIGLDIHHAETFALNHPRPGTLIGLGKIDQLAKTIEAAEIGVVVVDAVVSPVQQRNLEKALGAKVIDRTGLILEIFGRRARTREGALQVELAHLSYQKSRLVRSWTHLERQRGGFGFLGGPGETQIEADRRMIQERMTRIEKELDQVKRTRRLQRAGRKRVPFPVVALVGYTNAGKSTLFNALTRADVLAKDMLFATLDPTLRQIRLPQGSKAILSDTVGFISDLPTQLVAAFRATLEEVIEADLILHVRDMAHEDAEGQGSDVAAVLGELDIRADDPRLIEVWNKVDQVAPETAAEWRNTALRSEDGRDIMVTSALTGEGLESLRSRIEERLTTTTEQHEIVVPATAGALIHWIYENSAVISSEALEDGETRLTLRISPAKVPHLLTQMDALRR